VLEVLADAGRPLRIAEVADALGVHRSIVYRILRTLEDHRLVSRGPDGACELGVGLAVLSRSVRHDLQTAALPELSDLADELAMTSFAVVADADEAVTLLTVEPRHSPAHVAYRPGVRHPLDRGAPGIALLAGSFRTPGERPEVAQCRVRGWARSSGEVIAGMNSVAAPVVVPGRGVVAAVAVVFVDSATDLEAVAARVVTAARSVAAALA
jgi:DNA-binding IclR family transcriptional regulator